MSRNLTLRVTVAPASRHTRANILSVGTARLSNLPDCGQAARCLPKISFWPPHCSTCCSCVPSVPFLSSGDANVWWPDFCLGRTRSCDRVSFQFTSELLDGCGLALVNTRDRATPVWPKSGGLANVTPRLAFHPISYTLTTHGSRWIRGSLASKFIGARLREQKRASLPWKMPLCTNQVDEQPRTKFLKNGDENPSGCTENSQQLG